MATTYSEKFLDEHRDINVDHDWWDSVYDDFTRICTILGIELELFRDLARWLYVALENDYDHLTSDEAVAETLEANDIIEEEEE